MCIHHYVFFCLAPLVQIEVAELLVELYETTCRGDFTVATQVMETHAGASTAASVEATAPGISDTPHGSGDGAEGGSFSTSEFWFSCVCFPGARGMYTNRT